MTHSFYINTNSGAAVVLSAYYFRSNMNTSTPMHLHDRNEFMYILEGRCTVSTPTETYHLTKGQVIFIEANILHNLTITPDSHCRILNLEFTLKKASSPQFSLHDLISSDEKMRTWMNQHTPVLLLTDSGALLSIMKHIIMAADKHQSELKLHLLINQFLLEFADVLGSENHERSTDYIPMTLTYLYSHYDQHITVNEIAKHVNLHPNYLQRLFKQKMKVTLLAYLHQIRLNAAARLLQTTDYSILEISQLTGYETRQYFTSRFTKTFGLSPAQFRNSDIEWSVITND